MSQLAPLLHFPEPTERDKHNSTVGTTKLTLAIPRSNGGRSSASTPHQAYEAPAKHSEPSTLILKGISEGKISKRPALSLCFPQSSSSSIVRSQEAIQQKDDEISNHEEESMVLDNLSKIVRIEGYRPSNDRECLAIFKQLPETDSILDGASKRLEELRLALGRDPDVVDLDELAWKDAADQDRIVMMDSLGEGAGGAVTKCVLQSGSTVFALKVMMSTPEPDKKKQIDRELKFSKICASEHICRYYGSFPDDKVGTINMAMEYCEGGSLDAVYKRIAHLSGRIGEKPLRKIAENVLLGLSYLSHSRIIHRDIKPSNILFSRDGSIKLCDFGVSGETGPEDEAYTPIGTSYYMAPERITGQKYTITSDVWSLGITLLEVAYSHFPFPKDGTETRLALFDFLAYIVGDEIGLKDEPKLNINWSDDFKSFIQNCLKKQHDERLPPRLLLEHPWFTRGRQERVDVAHFLEQVWNW